MYQVLQENPKMLLFFFFFFFNSNQECDYPTPADPANDHLGIPGHSEISNNSEPHGLQIPRV